MPPAHIHMKHAHPYPNNLHRSGYLPGSKTCLPHSQTTKQGMKTGMKHEYHWTPNICVNKCHIRFDPLRISRQCFIYRINVSKTNRRGTWCHWPGWESYTKYTVEVSNKFEGGKAELGVENSRAPHPLHETLVDVNVAIYVLQKWAMILYSFCSLQTVRNEGTDIIEILAPQECANWPYF